MFKWQCHCNLPQFASFPQESRIHKDVKLENLMLLANSGPPHLVLIDLGVAETLQPQGLSAKWGV
jgi:serine/threonine protein kinase